MVICFLFWKYDSIVLPNLARFFFRFFCIIIIIFCFVRSENETVESIM